MRDYQCKKMKEYLMPEAVYRQALWAARDIRRLTDKLSEVQDRLGETVPSGSGYPSAGKIFGNDPTYDQAKEILNLSFRIESIERAFNTVPEDFRAGIRRKFMYGDEYSIEYEETIWKRWQQVFLYNVAVNLGIY